MSTVFCPMCEAVHEEGPCPCPSSQVDRAPLQPHDAWRNRGTFVCETCMYYVPKGQGPASMAQLGRCRRHAPKAGGEGWPVVTINDWCGDHKLKADA